MPPRRDTLANPWFGVSLGGWLLLEPGPSYPLFTHHPDEGGQEARCEWDLMKIMRLKFGKKRTTEVMKSHRDTHITKADFERIRSLGLNAVRLPFGYWVVTEPRNGEPYVGPAIEYVDRAVDWAEECGLQIMLDLHGCPGGESPEAPCGRRQRPESKWNWRHWDFTKSLEILEMLAKRYCSRSCVTGIAVCNEPSGAVPTLPLLRYYSQAVDRIRKVGMSSEKVAVVLPVFQRGEGEDAFIKKWWAITRGRHHNVCFDVHCYNCFENEFNGKTFAQQLRAVEANAQMLREHPMVVGEWSLALGCATWCTAGNTDEDTIYSIFGAQQLAAFKEASHGFFFWTWKEAPHDKEWNFENAVSKGLMSRLPRQLPEWDGTGEDPLEEELHPSPADASVFYGEPIYLRVFYGKYVETIGAKVNASYADKGAWQEFRFEPATSSFSDVSRLLKAKREVRHRDIVRLRTHNGRYLAIQGDNVCTSKSSSNVAGEFEVLLEGERILTHRGTVFLRSRATSMMLDADPDADGLYARYTDSGVWQALAVEKNTQGLTIATGKSFASSSSSSSSIQAAQPASKKNTTGKFLMVSNKEKVSPKNLKRRAAPIEVSLENVLPSKIFPALYDAMISDLPTPAKAARLG